MGMVDVKKITEKKFCPFDNKNLNIICVANVNRWHALDRLIMGLSDYDGEVHIKLHIVGDGTEIFYLKELTQNFGLDKQVIFHGFLSGKKLDDIYDESHIAVGSLGMHRIGIYQATVLKVREYTAKGIPFIIGYSDPDFSEDFPYLLKVTADDSNIDIHEIIKFASSVYLDPFVNKRMREFANNYLDWDIKMEKTTHFLRKLK